MSSVIEITEKDWKMIIEVTDVSEICEEHYWTSVSPCKIDDIGENTYR